MRKVNLRIGIAIAIYSFFLTAIFVGGLYVLRSSSISDIENDYNFVVLSEQDWTSIMIDGNARANADKAARLSDIGSYFTLKSFDNLPVVITFIGIFVTISSIVLWLVFRSIQEKNNELVIESLQIQKNEKQAIASFTPAIEKVIEQIRQKFEDNLESYQRLNSYVSHDHKNFISILRANMELRCDTDSISILDRLSDSIDDILTLSDNNSLSDKSPVDVALVCATACDNYKSITNNIIFDFREDDNTTILAKERWIYRAISNLLDNAVKYGENKPIELTVRNKNHSVLVTVRDYGIGISKDKQDFIFQNRYRINELNKDGYGIGLSLVSHVCELCDGFVLLESEENKGSCFYLSFPEYNEV